MQSLVDILKTWSKNTDSRAKLQQAYLASALALLLIAGMIGLVNYQFGQQMLLLALVAGSIFIINAVAWALLQSFILIHLNGQSQRAPSVDEPEEEVEAIEEEAPAKVKTKPKPKTTKASTKKTDSKKK